MNKKALQDVELYASTGQIGTPSPPPSSDPEDNIVVLSNDTEGGGEVGVCKKPKVELHAISCCKDSTFCHPPTVLQGIHIIKSAEDDNVLGDKEDVVVLRCSPEAQSEEGWRPPLSESEEGWQPSQSKSVTSRADTDTDFKPSEAQEQTESDASSTSLATKALENSEVSTAVNDVSVQTFVMSISPSTMLLNWSLHDSLHDGRVKFEVIAPLRVVFLFLQQLQGRRW